MRFPFCILFLTALTATAQTRQATPNFYSREKETALGAAVAQQFLRTVTPLDDPAALDYVQRLGAQLAGTLPEPRFPYAFTLITTDENNALHEPFSFPGGYIVVPASLFLASQDKAEFAGMLAHAMAHVQARHGTRAATDAQLAKLRTSPLIFTGGTAGLGPRPEVIPLSFAKFEPAYEEEADLIAVKMTSAAGYDPEALARYFGRVWPENPPDPARDTRISAILSAIRPVAPANFTDEFLRIQAEIRERSRN
jgi:predicted Zn-dependent protease